MPSARTATETARRALRAAPGAWRAPAPQRRCRDGAAADRARKVAVVVRLLLAPLRDGAPLRLHPAARFLDEGATRFEHRCLALDLGLERALHGPERVHVLHL